jgi:hypothetical protein
MAARSEAATTSMMGIYFADSLEICQAIRILQGMEAKLILWLKVWPVSTALYLANTPTQLLVQYSILGAALPFGQLVPHMLSVSTIDSSTPTRTLSSPTDSEIEADIASDMGSVNMPYLLGGLIGSA